MNHIFFYIMCTVRRVFVSPTWEKGSARMHYGKKNNWQRQCDKVLAFINVVADICSSSIILILWMHYSTSPGLWNFRFKVAKALSVGFYSSGEF